MIRKRRSGKWRKCQWGQQWVSLVAWEFQKEEGEDADCSLLNINALNLGSGNAGNGGDASSGNALGGDAGCHYWLYFPCPLFAYTRSSSLVY